MTSPGTAVTTHVSSPPASSPPDSYDPVLVSQPSSANRSPSSVIKRLDDIFGASEHLPVPRTPANPRHRQPSPASELPDYASEYYTAAWGSPYQLSPSSILSQSARTAVSEQAQSDRFTNSSPGPSFSLEHLIPSRFNEPPSVTSHPSLEIPSAYPQEEDTEHTPRSRTKRWAQVPYRPLPRSQWYSDDSVFTARSRDVSVSTRASSGSRAARGHKTREENRTLDQQSFWNILQETKEPNMSSLQASRWAATPTEEETPVKAPVWQDSTTAGYFDGKPLPHPPSEDDELPVETPRAAEDSGVEKAEPEPDQEQEPEQEPEQQLPSIEVSEEELIKDVPQEQKPADLVKPMPEIARLAPPKLRKRVSWRGKNCIISIPRLDYEALGLMKPMSSEDFQQRLKDFED